MATNPRSRWETSSVIRPRAAGDIACCVSVLRAVHREAGYPAQWPRDPAGWLVPPGLLAAWVAVRRSAVVGHVALCRAPDRIGSHRWPALLGAPVEAIAVARQLFVSPDHRGEGLGTALLTAVTVAAHDRGLLLGLDVFDRYRKAIDRYESAGWSRLATGEFTFADGTTEPIHYYRAPPE